MKLPAIKKLNIPELMSAASHLPLNGKLTISNDNLVYLDIDDAYIHQLFPLLKFQQIKKPNYFDEKTVGAHISVFYPEENKRISKEDLDQEHYFAIKDIAEAKLNSKTYYVLLIESSSLLKLRNKYKLTDMLTLKGYSIGFHITIGVST